MRTTLNLSLLLLFLFITFSTSAQSRRSMSPQDILNVATVSEVQFSPNGQWVLYSVATVDGDKNITTLWVARPGQEPRPATESAPTENPSQSRRNPPYVDWPEIRSNSTQLLPPGWSASSPRWSPDSSTIAFLSSHDEQNGLWTVKLDRVQPRLIAAIESTNFFITYAGNSFAWAPDSRRIAYISSKSVASIPTVGARRTDDPVVIDRMQYKSRTALADNRRSHVWVVDLDRLVPQQLTAGGYYDHAVSFSPRGDEVVFLSNHEPDPDAVNNSDIFAVDMGGQIRRITDTRGCEYNPAWSPDGKWIAYTATKREVTTIDSVAEDSHLWVIAAGGGGGRELAVEQDRRVRSPQWSADSKSIYFLANDRGYTTIFRTALDGGPLSRFSLFLQGTALGGGFDQQDSKVRSESNSPLSLAQPFQITSFSLSGRAQTVGRTGVPEVYPVAFAMGHTLRPAEVWLSQGLAMPLRRLSAHNESLLRPLRLTGAEEINYPSFDGTPIQGWLMKPAICSVERKCPLILSIHGGPHGMFGWSFNSSFQVYAGRNYAVLYLNPRGSSGYGQKFADGTLNEWGGGDYRDLMMGVDEALKKYPWIDGNRLAVTGGSYGGFMTNWIVTQTPRFRAAVAVASLSNLISFYATSLYQDLIHAEFGGFPWDNYELLWQWSPLRYVRQVQTPIMFIHGEDDNDVHITQAEEMYTALKRREVDTIMVRYPREGHGLREPKHRVDALQRTIAWFDSHMR
jgi:dipeptidyl aminopeptidase/acylaminoacyl peptidase